MLLMPESTSGFSSSPDLENGADDTIGASNINQASTFDSLQQASCSSCEIQDDKSAYWTPPLYYQHSNGSFEEVHNDGMTVYYLGRGNDKNIQPFPPGFRMVSGNKNARSYNKQALIPGSDRPIADRVSFACLDANPSKEQPGMTETNCKNGLRAQVHFQSCWNGKDLYKPDNSHVEYMSGLDNGVCPPTHPVPLMHIFFEVLYGVNDINKDGGRFVFSQGDTTGFGFHGDFLNGWKPEVLAAAIPQCGSTNDGDVDDCAPFKPSLDPKFSKTCPELPSLLSEPIHGMIDKLPGCITITSGPQDATDADYTCGAGKSDLKLLNSTVNAAQNLTGAAATTLIAKASAAKASVTNVSARKATTTKITAAAKATPSSKVSDNDDDDTKINRRALKGEPLKARGLPHKLAQEDDYDYSYDIPTTTTRGTPVVYGSPAPHHRRNGHYKFYSP
ncbi:MAG: hypothetical protein Q9201_006976 [Fulgogasparrea decipioides]